MAQIDLQMQEVLDVFEELGPKPIEQLDPTEARQQSTPADAAMRAVEKRGDTPEPDYPAAHDDAFAAYRWVLENMEEIGGDGRLAIAGESAAGNLAASVSLRAKEEGLAMPVHELLAYPIADGDSSKPAYIEHGDAKPLNTPMMEWFAKHYRPDANDPRFALTKADLSGLPPTTIVNAEVDPLRDDGPALAERLRAAGVDVEHRKFDGVTHEFFGMGAAVDKAKQAVQYAAGRLSQAFERAGIRA